MKKVVPTVRKLIPVLKEKIGWKWSPSSLKRLLRSMGFVWKRCVDKRRVLIERADIVAWRSKYLTKIRQCRSEGQNVFYLDESWVDTNLTFQKCWQRKNDVRGIMKGNATKRLIIVHIGSRNGFLTGGLLMYRSGTTSGDYHGEMNAINFEKWLSERVLPNLPPSSVIVLDNAPYHTKQDDKPPSKYTTKNEMITWLKRRGITCDETMRKSVLIELIDIHKPREKVYRVDRLLHDAGHTVIRLPPYMCEFNAIELAWAKIKRCIRESNTVGEFSAQALQSHTLNAINSVTQEDWIGYCNHVEKLEHEYWQRDCVMDIALDQFVINLRDDSDSDGLFSSNSDSDNTNTDSSCDSDSASSCLAQPL